MGAEQWKKRKEEEAPYTVDSVASYTLYSPLYSGIGLENLSLDLE